MSEVRLALRTLLKTPMFTAVAVLSLALGIGANTAMFGLVDQILLRLLPVQNPRELVQFRLDGGRVGSQSGDGVGTFSYPYFLAVREQNTVLSGLTGQMITGASLVGDDRNEIVTVGLVAANFFDIFGVRPHAGRLLTLDDDKTKNGSPVAVLQYNFWRNRFGSRADLVGSTIRVNGSPFTVVGIADARFESTDSGLPTQLWVPVMMKPVITPTWDELENERYAWFYLFGRLKPGVTRQQAEASLKVLHRQRQEEELKGEFFQKFPDTKERFLRQVFSLQPASRGQSNLRQRFEQPLVVLQWLVGLVLLIACANVANLMLVRATVRSREMGIRAALGASRSRLVRALLVESILLSLAGAAAGILLAYFGVAAIHAWLPSGLPRVASIGIDLRVLTTAIAVSIATGILFGIVPAFQSSRPDLTRALSDSSRSATSGTASQKLRSVLVVVEVALAVVLRIDPGFDYRRVLLVNVGIRIPPGPYNREVLKEAEKRGRPYALQMLEAVRAVPGVETATAVSGGVPLTGGWSRTRVELPGKGELAGADNSVDRRIVTPGYLEMLHIPLMRGRSLSTEDTETSQRVVVINQAAARKYWPEHDPLGQRFKMNNEEFTVVGIVGDIRHLGPEIAPRQETYAPLSQNNVVGMTLALKTHGDPMTVLPAVKAAIWSVNKDQRISGDTFTLEQYMDRLIAQRRFNMTLLALFGGLGLVIAAVGIYGVMAYLVAQRTNEIGIRMALGATRGNVVGMVLRRAGMLMATGLVLGAIVAWYGSAAVNSFLFDMQPNDLRILTGALLTLAAAGLFASALPARRAASVDPLVALRHQ
jgi:putative ABC transport system permease protein